MNQQFKKTTLFRSLLCIASIGCSHFSLVQTVYAEDSTQKAMNSETAQQFYQKYYLTPQQLAEATRSDLNASARCSGTWVTPIASDTPAAKDPTQVTSTISADEGYYNPEGSSFLQGNVEINQEGRRIYADKVELDKTQTYAKAQGRVQVAQGGLFAQSDEVNYNLKTQTGDLNNSYYISEAQQAHGYAQQIERTSPTTVTLKNASYSTCEPTAKPAWHIEAKEITLNQETGRGITKSARLYIKDTPVVPVPYFNFPIDDRRTTGFLMPNFGYTNDGGLQLTVPYYFNLAPNYDLTVTPRYLGGRGFMLNGDFRYLTENYGSGEMWGGYLPNDQSYDDEDRKDLHWKHFWQINKQFSTSINYNYVSDQDFFSDLDNSLNTQDEVNQERTWILNYANGIPGITAQLKVQNFQTLDRSISDADKPYARLPQFLFKYEGGKYNGLEYSFLNDTAYFKKSIEDGSATEDSGTRLYNQATVKYNFRNPGYWITPEFTVRSVNTYYDEDAENSGRSNSSATVVPQVSLDAGMVFEKQGKFLQTITPRFFYAYAPYRNQDNNPNFDTAQASIGYDQLFNPYRFYGHDRLEDNNFASIGVNYSLYDQQGLERLRAGLGQAFYFSDRRVYLNNTDQNGNIIAKDRLISTEKTSGPVLTLGSQLSNNINLVGNSAWTSGGENALSNISVNYADDKGLLYSLGYYYRKSLDDQRQQAYEQIAGSFVQPINDRWRILGHVQYDLHSSTTREWLLGVNYESCCWGVSVYARSYYNDLDDPTEPGVKAKQAIMAEFSLKGLGGLSGKLASLLENRVTGFDYVNQTWNQH
ncbi:LPS-assembly protein LptD [Acinetobacter qingfengensis]|uniref:LPS-assembly protein LptD n=1 Tax=Acinetobacter qingfengensis TaxID=1262585 RepID=A0A1E7RFB9_9GAMM|nr:LPS-assembly protein LptD [Acinetobacter qingfengensis]KAA8735644.1 LPS-assembly protein LptD [Acinetobacter qingfengensis]OEY97952.1 LPS export ABC transporter periplasmic protein LptC [Acinetobacter qingfengensis]